MATQNLYSLIKPICDKLMVSVVTKLLSLAHFIYAYIFHAIQTTFSFLGLKYGVWGIAIRSELISFQNLHLKR